MIVGVGLTTSIISTKAVLVAGTIFAVMQVVKKFTNFAFLHDKWGVVVNVAMSVIGTVAVTPPSQLFTQSFLISAVTTAFLAAGFHSITTNIAPNTIGTGK
jgi:hypothetical protein